MQRPVLWSLPYSPWSEQARWALDVAGIDYDRKPYAPLTGELGLRIKLRRPRGVVSVPILETSSGVLADSLDIAEFAAAHATTGVRLFLDPGRVRAYAGMAGAAMSAGRALALPRVLTSRASLADLVPRGLRDKLGRLAPSVAAFGVKRTLRKYAAVTPAERNETLRTALDTLRRALGGRQFLLEELSYADITCAQVLAFIDPPTTSHLRLTEATRAVYRDPELAESYRDLLHWRDELYQHHRTPAH